MKLISNSNVDVLLITPPKPSTFSLSSFKVIEYDFPPLGIFYLSTYLNSKGINSEAYDLFYYNLDSIIKLLKFKSPKIVGISLSGSNERNSARELSKLVKSILPDALIVFGGHHSTFLYSQLLNHYCADYVVLGEGEFPLLELSNHFIKNTNVYDDNIPNIAYKKNGIIFVNTESKIDKIDLNTYPSFSYDEIDFQIYRENYFETMTANIISGRGCNYNCGYCASGQFWKGIPRYHNIKEVKRQVQLLNSKFGFKEIAFCDDLFSQDEARLIEICNSIIKEKLDVSWWCQIFPGHLSNACFEKMKASGCRRVYIGVDVASYKIQKTMGKGINPWLIKEQIEMARKARIITSIGIIIGYPNENDETIQDSIDLINFLKPDWVGIQKLVVFPGTSVYEIAKKMGYISDDYWLSENPAPYYFYEHNINQFRLWNEKYLKEVKVKIKIEKD